MTALTLTITDTGRAALINAEHTGLAPVTIAQVGVSASALAPTPTTASLPGEIKRLTTFSGAAVAADTLHITIRDDSTASYALRSFALYLNDGTLFALYGQSDPVMHKSANAMLLLSVDVKLLQVAATSITFGNANFLNPPATTTVQGVVELATSTEAKAGTDTDRAITPKALKDVLNVHEQPWGRVTGIPATATRWPKWGEVTEKPAGFPPASHTHSMNQVGGLVEALNDKVQTIKTAPEDITQRISSGFYQQSHPGPGWPVQETAWWNLLSLTHANPTNYYALQLACKFGGHGLMFRNTANNGSAPWYTLWHSGNFDPDSRLKTTGGTLSGHLTFKAAASAPSSEVQFRDETHAPRANVFWHRPSDSLRARRYNATTGVVENELWLRESGALSYTGGPITAPGGFNGNATSANKLTSSTRINGTSFNGTADIITSRWGAERTLKIGNAGKPVNGTGNVTWTLAEIGAAPASHAHAWSDITGTPETFPAAAHTHAWGDVTGKPAQATRWPKWGEVTEKPASFPPAAHTHDYLPLGGGTLTGDVYIEKGGVESKLQLRRVPGSGGRTVHLTSVNNGTVGIYDATNNGWIFRIDANNTAHLAGSLTATHVTATASDVRLKDDVEDLTDALSIVARLTPRRWRWKGSGAADFGFIAQEHREIVPEAVQENDGLWYVRYGKLEAVLVAAVKELTTRLDGLEHRIAALEARPC